MAYESFPNNAHNNRVLTLVEHEAIAAHPGRSGLLFYSTTAPIYADATGRQVKLRADTYAIVRGTRFNNVTETVVGVQPNTSGKTRVDLVVLRLRRQESSLGADDQYTVAPVVIQGVAGDNPVAPNPVRDSGGAGFWDLPLAEVTVINNAATIEATRVVSRAYFLTGSGYTGRDDWGKPPVEAGVLFRANDSGVTYIGTAAGSWIKLYDDSGWVNLTLEPGWSTAPSGRARVRRRNGAAYLSIDLFRTGASLSGGSVIVGKLPAGDFLPDATVIDIGAVNTTGGTTRFLIQTNGNVIVEDFTPIAKGSAVSIQTDWPLAA